MLPAAALACRFGLYGLRHLIGYILIAIGSIKDARGDQPGIRPDFTLYGFGDLGVILQVGLRVLPALPDALTVLGIPGARLLDDVGFHAKIDQFARLGDAFAIHNVEFDLLEGWSNLVLHDLDACLVADNLVAFLDLPGAPDIEPHGGVELKRVPSRRRLRIAEHHANLHADLVDEYN